MSSSSESPNDQSAVPILMRLQNVAFVQAKRWAAAVIALQVLLFVGGIASIFSESWSLRYPWLAFLLAVAGVVLVLRAAHFKGRAELLKRQHEYLDGLGCRPSERTLANLRAELPDDLQPEVQQLLAAGVTYASQQPAGLNRVLENMCESAFFSHHLAKKCATYLLIVLVVCVVLALALLLFCLETLHDSQQALVSARTVAATLVFLISVGALRSWRGYASFATRADQVHGEAAKKLADGEPDLGEAHRLLSEYQLARASAPLIPTWVWACHRTQLNQIWTDRSKT